MSLELAERPDSERCYFVRRQEAQQDWRREAQAALKLLRDGQLGVHYQPKLEVNSGRVTGREALLRLQDASGQHIPPRDYLPALERVGFGDLLDLWMVRRVVEDIAQWWAQGLVTSVAINLTASTL